ncbi:MAG: hypothetical protein WC107_03445 [Patescibacteria group bacterium]
MAFQQEVLVKLVAAISKKQKMKTFKVILPFVFLMLFSLTLNFLFRSRNSDLNKQVLSVASEDITGDDVRGTYLYGIKNNTYFGLAKYIEEDNQAMLVVIAKIENVKDEHQYECWLEIDDAYTLLKENLRPSGTFYTKTFRLDNQIGKHTEIHITEGQNDGEAPAEILLSGRF